MKVADFGTARFFYPMFHSNNTEEGATKDGEFTVGTPAYSAPELLRGEKQTFASDVFSFGIVMWGTLIHSTLFVCMSPPHYSL